MLKNCFFKSTTAIKLLLLFLFIFANNNLVLGQNKLLENWEEKLSKTKGQDRVDLILQLSEDLANEDVIRAKSLAQEGISLAEKLGDTLSMYRILAHLGKIHTTLGEKDEGIAVTKRSLNYFAKNKNLTFDKAKLQLSLAIIHFRKREYEKCDSLISDSETFFISTNDKLWQSKIPYTKGSLYIEKQEYNKAEDYFSEALRISEPVADVEYRAKIILAIGLTKYYQHLYPEALELMFQVISMECSSLTKARCYSYIGYLYRNLEDWEPAVKYTKMNIDLKNRMGLECATSYGLYNLGVIYKRQLNFGEGLKYYKQCLALQKKCDLNTSQTIGAIGNIYNALGEIDKANKYYDEQMELAVAQNDWKGIWNVHYNRGYYAYKAKKYDDALKYAFKSLQIAKEKESLHFLMKNNDLLRDVYFELGNKEKTKFHDEQFQLYQDSISGLQKIKEIGALEQKHLTKLQKDSLDLANQSDMKTNPTNGVFNNLNAKIGLVLLILLITIFFLFFIKANKKTVPPTDKKTVDRSVLDQYFKELFTRLDQKETTTETTQNISSDASQIKDISKFLINNLSTPNDWASFEHYFEKIHKDFFKNLKIAYPNISVSELNMCALLKLNLLNKDIAHIVGISPDSVRKAQNRLSKRLELPKGEVLRDFIIKL